MEVDTNDAWPYIVVLGIAQDGGYPRVGCRRRCCAHAASNPCSRRLCTCLAIVDPVSLQRWLIEATPDIVDQLNTLDAIGTPPCWLGAGIDGILLTRGDVAHYGGLMYWAQQSMANNAVKVYAMPRMREFLTINEPWCGMVNDGHIRLEELEHGKALHLNERISVTPVHVPCRNETGYSEAAGFQIQGPRCSVLYFPSVNVDKWAVWEDGALGGRKIEELVHGVDTVLLDGTFYADGEIEKAAMTRRLHPRVVDSISRFNMRMPIADRCKVHFIHFSHTNPLLQESSAERMLVIGSGFQLAEEKHTLAL